MTMATARFKPPEINLLTPDDVAKMFGRDRVTILRWVRRGKLKAVKMTYHTILFRPSDIQAAIDRRAK